MKTKIFLFASFCLGLSLASCNDDDSYTIYTDPVMTEDSVVTGSADVTATSATLYATVDGVENLSSASYTAGFRWGYSENSLNETIGAAVEGQTLTATLNGLTENTVIYYQAYVTLSGKVTFAGEIKSLVTTDARVVTAQATAVDFAAATMGASVTGAPADATYGVVISANPDTEAVRAGLIVKAGKEPSFTVEYAGLAPATTYYYAGYADLGSGVVYGDVASFTTAPITVDLDNDMVDLGLSVKWARRNVGARTDSELGGLFGYGEISGVSTSISTADYTSGDIYRTASDVANKAWNGKVTLPTAADFEELFTMCSKEWTEVDGVQGYKLTGPNGNSIFLPAAGSRTLNSVSNAGVNGVYGTGSANAADNSYAIAFRFGSAGQSRTALPVYEALSIRPVSTARTAKLNLDQLCITWEIDYNAGETVKWNGPVWFMGADDCWGTITNSEPVVGDSWLWDADKSNTWAFGDCTGYVTFAADGTVTAKNQDGEEQTGKYTIDYEKMVINADIDLLSPSNFPSQVASTKSVKILSCSDEGLQLGYTRASDNCTLCVNYVPQNKKYGFESGFMCIGQDFAGEWGGNGGSFLPADLEGKHTISYSGSVTGAKVLCIDVKGLHEAYPDAIVTVSDIRCDGKSIKFDASKFYYGDLENNGNFRVQLYNIWGTGSENENVHSPFSDYYGNLDLAFGFTSSLEIDYYITLNPTFTPNLITINPDWQGTWGYNEGASFKVVADASGKLVASPSTLSFNYAPVDVDHSAGSIMTFIEVKNFMHLFPGAHSVLNELKLDGKAVTGWDASRIYDTNDGDGYRLELWNAYGVSNGQGCAFGVPVPDSDPGIIKELGFSTSMSLTYTIDRLFTPVVW